MRFCNGAIASGLLLLPLSALAACTPNTTNTAGLQSLIQRGGAGYTLSLCPNQIYSLTDTLNFTAASQEISTQGYPRDSSRALLVVTGNLQTTAIQGTSPGLDYVKLRNIQINGNRGDNPIYTKGGANIEMGGGNNGHLIEHVRSYDPRQWSCMHLAEGPFTCRNATIQNNDIGPCGSDFFQYWSDGISLSCSNSLVQNNTIVDATDGGIVIFGAPGSHIRNNRIHVETRTMLGGINMVDVTPWLPFGNYSGTVVENNYIAGGFATSEGNATLGPNNASAVIKIGLAVGPRTWFNDQFGTNRSTGAVVQNNVLTGAFSFGLAVSSANDFVITNNSFTGNVSFVGTYGPNCTTGDNTPLSPRAVVVDPNTVGNLTFQSLVGIGKAGQDNTAGQMYGADQGTVDGNTCFIHPGTTEDAWPYGGGGVNSVSATSTDPGADAGVSNTSDPATGSGPSSPAPTGAAGRRAVLSKWVKQGALAGTAVLGMAAAFA